MKKKVLFVIDSMRCGGAEKSLVSLLNVFNYNLYEVDLVLFSPDGLYLNLLPKEVNILNLPNYFVRQKKGYLGLFKNGEFKDLYLRARASLSLRNPMKNKILHSAQIVWKWASKGISNLGTKYDVAIAYSQGLPTYFVCEKVTAKKKLSWVNTDYKAALYNKHFDINYYREFDHIIAVSDLCKDAFVNEMPDFAAKVEVIYDILSPSLVRSLSLESTGFKDKYEGLRLLTIGRLIEQKGYDLAIETCYELKKEGYQIRWYAIGDGEKKIQFQNQIREYGLSETFIFLGTYANPYPFIKQCDIYIQPSKFEGFGLALAEARILHKPIVVTNFSVVSNQIKHDHNGLIASMESKAMANQIKRIINDKTLTKRLCENLRKEQFGTEREVYKLYSLINA